MSIRSQLFRATSILCLLLIAVGPVSIPVEADETTPNPKPITQNNRSSQSSRYGDRLQQMKSRSSSPSTTRSSSVSRTSPSRSQSSASSRSSSSYRPSPPASRSSSSSSAMNRSRPSTSSANDRSRSSSSYSRERSTPSSSYTRTSRDRASAYTRSSNTNRSSSYTRSTTTPSPSSSYQRNTTPSSSSSVNRSRGSSSNSSYARNRSSIPSTTYDRNRSNGSSSTYTRNQGSNSSNSRSSVTSQDRRSSSSYNSRTRANPFESAGNYDRSRGSSYTMNRTQRNDVTTNVRPDMNRGGSSDSRSRDQRTTGRSYSRQDNNHTSYDRNRGYGSQDRYSHSRNSNRDRNKHIHSGYHNRYVFDYHRYKDSRHYHRNKFLSGAYCPFYDRLYHHSYFNRRYYSPTVFSTVILSAGVTNTIYDNYDYGNYTTYKSTEPFVELYEHAGFRGESLQVFAGEAIYNLRDIRFDSYKSFNDRFSSLKVYGEVTVILYVDRDLGGEYIYLHGSHIDFSRDSYLRRFNDRVSSIEVVPGIIHEKDHRSGSRDYLLNSHLLDASPYQEPVSSAAYHAAPIVQTTPAVPAPTTVVQTAVSRVILYDQPNYQGNQIILTPGDVHVDLLSLNRGLAGTWNDCVSSIRVEGNTELFIYCDRDFRGDGIAIRGDVPNLAVDTNLVPFVNRVSSVVVNPSY